MDRMLSFGSTGPDVRQLQLVLNQKGNSLLRPLIADGIFGPKTAARVQEFQRNRGLVPDGIVGPRTWAALRAGEGPAPVRPARFCCCNGHPQNLAREAAVRNELAAAFSNPQVSSLSSTRTLAFAGAPGSGGGIAFGLLPSLPSFKSLTAKQIADATAVYGSSIDFSTVFISDKAGFSGRAFTVAMSLPGLGSVQVMNCGTFSPTLDTLIHELAHVWQSQHHSSATAYMTNAVASQAAAVAASGAEALIDPSIKSDPDFPVNFPFSAYACIPGKPFSSYAAEQIANQVEHGIAAIVAHVRAASAGSVDSDNVTSLATTRIGDYRVSGTI